MGLCWDNLLCGAGKREGSRDSGELQWHGQEDGKAPVSADEKVSKPDSFDGCTTLQMY